MGRAPHACPAGSRPSAWCSSRVRLGALFGAYLTHSTVGSGHVPDHATGAVLVGAVTLSLLIRPRGSRPVRSAAAQ